jgi:Pyruvate/2-oxoacid:ferredoxin oxidoreductase delta subunit
MTFLAAVPVEGAPTEPSRRTDMLHCAHYYKDAMLGRFYAICNCCSCCCGAMYAHQHGTPMLASSGYVAQVDADLCVGCGTCADDCLQEAITLVRDPARGEPLEIQKLIAEVTSTAKN